MDKYTMGDIHKALSLLEGEDPVVIEREELEELRQQLSRLSTLASTPDNRGRARRRALWMREEGMKRFTAGSSLIARSMPRAGRGVNYSGCTKGHLIEELVIEHGDTKDSWNTALDKVENSIATGGNPNA